MISLEESIHPGIYDTVKDKTLRKFPDYTTEIKEFLATRKPSKKTFINQDKRFKKIASKLSSKYPYVVLIGESGIGKSLMLDYAVKILTNEIPLEELKETVPKTHDLFKQIKKNLVQCQHRDYLLLPNMQSPLNPTSISYIDKEEGKQDNIIARNFCDEISGTLLQYCLFSGSSIKREFTKDSFRNHIQSSVFELYQYFYEEITGQLDSDMEEEIINTLSFLTLNTPKSLESKLTGTWKIDPKENSQQIYDSRLWEITNLDKDDYKEILNFKKIKHKVPKHARIFIEQAERVIKKYLPSPLEQSIKDLNTELSKHGIRKILSRKYDTLISTIKNTKISGLNEKEIEEIFIEEFSKASNEICDLIEESKEESTYFNNEDILELLSREAFSNRIKNRKYPVQVSNESIEEILNKIEKIHKNYRTTNCSQKLSQWIDSTVNYFKENPHIIQGALTNIIEEYSEKLQIDELIDFSEDFDYEPKKHTIPDFEIRHGRFILPIQTILRPNYLGDPTKANTRITATKIRQVKNKEHIFGSFDEYLNSDTENAPHRLVRDLGSFFESGILLFDDSFSSFIEGIVEGNEEDGSQREQFLEFLQTGNITITHQGINYEFEAPRMILGCDNNDPFITINGIFPQDETGFRGRIQTINVPCYAQNTKETRFGTLEILYKTIDEYNKNHNTNLTVSNNAANLLLQSNLIGENYISLEYRDFEKEIQDICNFATENNKQEVNSKLLKQRNNENKEDNYFGFIDIEDKDFGYFDQPQKEVGRVHGLSVIQMDSELIPGGIVRINSYTRKKLSSEKNEPYFVLLDEKSELIDKTAFKGFSLVEDYIKFIFQEANLNPAQLKKIEEYQLKTQFIGNWHGMGGPSASLAITLSNISALTQIPVYKNRFFTGTLEPNGIVERIGGAYEKALTPLGLQELNLDQEPKYFIYPAKNFIELQSRIGQDPFNLEEKIACLPVTTFGQAFYLATQGSIITLDMWQNSNKKGEELMQNIYEKIKPVFPQARRF